MSKENIPSIEDKKPSLLHICYVFFYLGLTTFGGGASMLINISRELIDKRKWMNEDELYEHIAVAQCSPGIIMVNTATLFGVRTYGMLGAILATLSLLIAPFTIISILTLILHRLALNNELMEFIYVGIRAGMCGISIRAIINLFKKNISDVFTFIIAILALAAIIVFSVKTIYVIIAGIIIGITASYIREGRRAKNE